MGIHLQTWLLVLWSFAATHPARAQAPTTAPVAITHQADVIYGRKDGMALTMDVIAPKEHANGIGLLLIYSGGWFSAHNFTPASLAPFTNQVLSRGYTVFVVVHGSQPRYTIVDAIMDVKRAVRFVRVNAKRWNVDPERLGVMGGSAGGHLSLMVGLASDDGNPEAPDPVDRESSRVKAVTAWFPPTDFLDYGEPGKNALATILAPFKAAFDFRELVKTRYVQITDEKRIEQIEKQISPATYVSPDDPPVLLFHGDKDNVVPIQQSELLVDKLKKVNVPVKLVIRHGRGHGWGYDPEDGIEMANWFDKYLVKAPSTQPAVAH